MDLKATISASCRELEAAAAMMGVSLKIGPDSVGDLERILLALRELQADESATSGATFMVGVYLGEILRTVRSGVWRRSLEGDLLLEIAGTTYAPVEKVRKFAANPDGGDGLGFYASAVLAGEV
jgi:hypothetical protein